MKKRSAYYVSKRNALSWISAILMLCSAAACVMMLWRRDAENGAALCFQILLPLLGSVLFVSLVLVRGETHFYRTAIPVWMLAIGSACVGTARSSSTAMTILFWVACILGSVVWTCVTAGAEGKIWLLRLAALAVAAGMIWSARSSFVSVGDFVPWWISLRGVFAGLAALVLTLAVRKRPENYPYCPTWGDRSDGRRLRSLGGMLYVVPYVMPRRSCCSNFVRETIDMEPVDKYIAMKREQGMKGFGLLHLFIAAYLRVAAKYPGVNRFCSGQHIFSRGRNVEMVMEVKVKMSTDAPGTMIKVHFDPADTVDDVYRKLNEKILEVKDAPLDSSFDKTAGALARIPGVAFSVVIWLIKVVDYFGLLPKFLLEVSPFHGSIILTSMASLGIPVIVHHLYDIGNLPVFVALGEKYRRLESDAEGAVVEKKYVDFTANLDERICDGYYYATCLKYLRRLLSNPAVLDSPPRQVKEDIP